MKKILCFLLIIAGLQTMAQTFKPGVKLEAGKKYTVVQTVKSNMAQEIMGQSMEIPTDITTSNLLEVKSVEKEKYNLSNTITEMLFSTNAMGQSINYDSKKTEDKDSEVGKVIGAMLNKPTTFSINNFGKVIEGSVVKPAADSSADGNNPMLGMVAVQNSETSAAINFFINGNEIKIGGSFTDSSTTNNGKDKKNIVYTLTEIKDGLAKFDVNGTMSFSKEMETQGMQLTTVMDTKLTGTTYINATNSLLGKSVLNSTINGSVEVQGMSIPITGTTSVTVTVTEQENK